MYAIRHKRGSFFTQRHPYTRNNAVKRSSTVKRVNGKRHPTFVWKAHDEPKMEAQRIREHQYGPDFVLAHNSAISTFISYPSLGKTQP
ncbi:BV1 protein, partial [Tomato golden mottle virus-[GT94-R2]]